MSDLVSLLDLADLAIARSTGVLDEGSRAGVATTARRLRTKAGYVDDFLVIALAGGTGSGKSSLLNGLVSESVVSVGAVRPTTSKATAVVPGGTEADFSRLTAALNIDDVISCDAVSSTILVDLPDFDSIEIAHRHIVELVLPTVDAVLWVFDPEKYADPVVHEEFLSRLADYGDQFVFVLNQVDRLGPDVNVVKEDLERLLIDDGFHRPEVALSIASGATRLDDLEAAIENRFDLKTTAVGKATVDLKIAANEAWRACFDHRATQDAAIDQYEAALAEATFVSLGVEAYDFGYTTAGHAGV